MTKTGTVALDDLIRTRHYLDMEMIEGEYHPATGAAYKYAEDIFREAIERLKPIEARVLEMTYIERRSVAYIASSLFYGERNIYKIKRRALQHLAKITIETE